MNYLLYIFLGLLAGVLSGFLGLGGGVILIPAFVFLLGMTQHQAQGTTLALMVPPIGLLAAMHYYNKGNVKLSVAAFVCIGFFIGGLLGAMFVDKIPDLILKKTFGVFLILVALKMIFSK
jgi:hypothetical protein